MAITPGAGYMVDPNNPNAVVPIGTSAQAQNLGTFNTGTTPSANMTLGAVNTQPASQTPPTPAPVQSTPSAPSTQPTTTTGAPTQQQGALTMPANGSVVDLLNMAGVDSSQTNRKALAQQYGIQNYDFSAAKNQELAQKFLTAYNTYKEDPVPQSGADFQQTQAFEDLNKQEEADAESSFMESYFSMNPVLKSFYDTMQQAVSSQSTRTSLVEEYQKMFKEEITPLQTELMDINAIIDGTEDDIRDEIAAAGGFGTESQIQALTMARNKTLLKRATAIEQTLQNKQDYVNQIIQLTGMDREQVDKDLDRKLGIAETMFNTFNSMQNAAAENYRALAEEVGYDGLAEALRGNPNGMYFAEMALGLPSGALTDPEFLAKASQKDWSAPYMLGGDYVQENLKTGEVRTAVNVAGGSGGGGSGSYGPMVSPDGNEWGDLMYAITQRPGIGKWLSEDLAATLTNAIETGNYNTMYQMVKDAAGDKLTAENKTKFDNASKDLLMMQDLQAALTAYQKAGGDMNFAKAAALNAGARVGVLAADKPYASLARQLDAVFQQYRQDMTGAAFGASESADYQKVRPSAKGSFDLNEAVINGAIAYADNFVTNTIQDQIGPSGVLVKQTLEKNRGISTAPTDGLSDDSAYELYLKMSSGNWTE